MNGDDLKRVSAVAGGGAFVLVMLLMLAFADPGRALMVGLLAGLGLGSAVLFAGSVALLSRPVELPAPRVSAVVGEPAEPGAPLGPQGPDLAAVIAGAAPVGAAGAGPAPEGEGQYATTAEDTAQITADQVVKAADLHQTVRLDAADLQYALAELSPEDVLREREGIDEAFLRAGAGIEEPKGASENVVEKQPEPGGK